MDEFEIIKRFFLRNEPDPNLKIGIGDDCAIFNCQNNLAITTDTLVENVHFFSDVDPYSLGYKSLAVNLSDLAAMGANPKYFLLALTLPNANESFLNKFSQGIWDLASKYNVKLIGGDLTHGPLTITITAIGESLAHKEITRSHAQVGDDIYISGTLGAAALGVFLKSNQTHLHDQKLEASAFKHLDLPEPRIILGQRLRGIASSMLDLSDGLSTDLLHILKLSHVGALIDLDLIPYDPSLYEVDLSNRINFALAGGDDYELCFTANPSFREKIHSIAKELKLPLTRIGEITSNIAKIDYLLNKKPFTLSAKGYNHFEL